MLKGGQKHPHQDSVDAFLRVPGNYRDHQARTGNGLGFSAFDSAQVEQATGLCAEFMKVANDNPTDPIKKVLEFAKEETKTTDPQLVRWALMIFIAHHSAARKGNLRIPSLIKRAPESVVPNKSVQLAPGPFIDRTVEETDAGDVESLLNWYREDPNYNEHHEHWHIIYTPMGIPDENNPDGELIILDRHGELFIYMHRQMLARYDTERLAINFPLIDPLDDYRAPIPQGYKPDDQLRQGRDEKRDSAFGSREANLVLGDLKRKKRGDVNISDMEAARDKILKAIDKGQFYDGTKIDINLLGATIESSKVNNKDNWDDFAKYYGSGLHAKGHLVIGYINDPSNADDPNNNPGVMFETRTSGRDPAFYRWHRHVDNLISKWEETQEPNDFSNSPPVKIRDGDIILAFKDKLPQDSEAADFGEQTFGGENFDTDVSDNEFATNVLETKMKTRLCKLVEDSGTTEKISYLYPREFYYFFRVENTSSSPLNATFRIYIVSEELANSRRHWIELDKFKQSLPPNSKTVVSRDCDMSSIVRQPPQKTPEELDDTAVPDANSNNEDQARQFCDCGWPFHLLLPRGRKGGMKFKLMAFITDWSEDQVPRKSRCGSISYCGAASPSEKYPDSKPMGYPFDRPFKNNSYEETFDGLDNATIKDVTINWVDDFPEVVAQG